MWMRVIIRGILMMSCFLDGLRGRCLFVMRGGVGVGDFGKMGREREGGGEEVGVC